MSHVLRAAALAVAIFALAASPARATFPGALGRVAYHSGGGEFSELWTDDPADDEPAVSLGQGSSPVWSPDGTMLAYLDWSECGLHQGGSTRCPAPSGIGVVGADGTGRRTIARTPPWQSTQFQSDVDNGPMWAPDGQSVYYFRQHNALEGQKHVHRWELRRASLAGGDVTVTQQDVDPAGLVDQGAMSPDGTTIAAIRWSVDREVLLIAVDSGAVKVVPGSTGASSVDWSPDGRVIAVGGLGADGNVAKVMTPAGVVTDGPFPTATWSHVTFTPDGSRLTVMPPGGEVDFALVGHLLADPGADIPAYETATISLGRVPAFSWDLQPQRQPIIFVHGFGGSRIACGADELWPPTLGAAGADLLDMRLDVDGTSPLPGACAAGATEILRRAYVFSDVYDSTLKFLEKVAPDDHDVFVYDWRKNPLSDANLQALDQTIQRALDRPLQRKQGVTRVVLMGHSMGGLVIRRYIGDAARAKRVARAVTIGTPYWGAPKSILPLAAGIETPEFSALDALLPNEAMKQLFRNLAGAYLLYPSRSYGPWLTVRGRSPAPLDGDGLLRYVFDLGGSSALLAAALGDHTTWLDEFRRNGVDYRAFVGTGLNTIGSVTLSPGGSGRRDAVRVGYTNGDGTVPTLSAAQDPGEPARGADDVPLSYVCGVGHVDLPGDAAVDEPLRDFLVYGRQPRKTREVCPNSGGEFILKGIKLARAARAAVAGTGLEDAAASGALQLLDVGDESLVVTDDRRPVAVAQQVDGLRIAATRIQGEQRGATRYYGPISGRLELKTAASGDVEILEDGRPVAARSAAEPGDPGTDDPEAPAGGGGGAGLPSPGAAGSGGGVVDGRDKHELARTLSADARRVARRLTKLGLRRLLARRGARLTGLTAPPGMLSLELTRTGHPRRLLAAGTRRVTGGAVTMRLKLTPAGLRTLRSSRRVRLRVMIRFTPGSGVSRRAVAVAAVKR